MSRSTLEKENSVKPEEGQPYARNSPNPVVLNVLKDEWHWVKMSITYYFNWLCALPPDYTRQLEARHTVTWWRNMALDAKYEPFNKK